ncbi:MAG: hypothetical protein AB7T49_02260 [Oligoflexales bacterium]
MKLRTVLSVGTIAITILLACKSRLSSVANAEDSGVDLRQQVRDCGNSAQCVGIVLADAIIAMGGGGSGGSGGPDGFDPGPKVTYGDEITGSVNETLAGRFCNVDPEHFVAEGRYPGGHKSVKAWCRDFALEKDPDDIKEIRCVVISGKHFRPTKINGDLPNLFEACNEFATKQL